MFYQGVMGQEEAQVTILGTVWIDFFFFGNYHAVACFDFEILIMHVHCICT